MYAVASGQTPRLVDEEWHHAIGWASKELMAKFLSDIWPCMGWECFFRVHQKHGIVCKQGFYQSTKESMDRSATGSIDQGGKGRAVNMTRIAGKSLEQWKERHPLIARVTSLEEVFWFNPEKLALDHGLITLDQDYSILDGPLFRNFFSDYASAVGSTGNLGLSIGIMGARLGFRVFVHMSRDAKAWKKELLARKGVTVVEHDADYGHAVAEGRRQAASDPRVHFVDDERSHDLFLGYATAAGRLKNQLEAAGRTVDAGRPLFVYLPCGVGGGPGGIAYGLKLLFGGHVHCFFAEPTHSPAMLLGLMTGLHDGVSVGDFGIDNVTEADGLAVGRPSGLVGRLLRDRISGVFTVDDTVLFGLLFQLARSESVAMEPSALAGMPGPVRLLSSEQGRNFLEAAGCLGAMDSATHVVWGTGGSMVPSPIMDDYMNVGSKVFSGMKGLS